MDIKLEHEDVKQIADVVVAALTPLLPASVSALPVKDEIFDVKGLAKYLKVSMAWVYKRTSEKAISFYKVGGKPRFRKSEIDKWMKKRHIKPLN